MHLSPSLRQKKRYIVFKIDSDRDFSISDIEEEITKALLSFLGELGVARSSPLLIKEKSLKNYFVLKVNHKYVDEVKSALILIKKIKNSPIILHSVITSGTLKKVSSYLPKS